MNINNSALQETIEKAKKYDELVKLEFRRGLHCSFCGKGKEIIEKLIIGPSVNICDECVSLCNEILKEK